MYFPNEMGPSAKVLRSNLVTSNWSVTDTTWAGALAVASFSNVTMYDSGAAPATKRELPTPAGPALSLGSTLATTGFGGGGDGAGPIGNGRHPTENSEPTAQDGPVSGSQVSPPGATW